MNFSYKQLSYINRTSLKEKFYRFIWTFVYYSLFRPTPKWALFEWRCFLLRLFGASIGEGCRISPSCLIWSPQNLEMGQYCSIGDSVDCYNVAKITIGHKSCISQRSFLCTASHDVSSLLRPLITKEIIIEPHVWIAAESMILPGISIGEGSVVGARSLVTQNLPSWHVCRGSPCLPFKPRIVNDLHLDPNIKK